DYEDESPLTALHDFHCEIKTQKEDVNASLDKICSEKKAVHEFMKASEILMQRNAADLGKIREHFQKYGYKSHDEANSESAMSVQNKSDEEKANDVLQLSASAEEAPLPKDPLRNPQLSDFGLSHYAFPRPWGPASARQLKAKSGTPLRVPTPRALPKTPKCKLKMDDFECVTPKLEHFGISEHTMCMNEDYTMSLIHKTSQTIKKQFVKHSVNLQKHCIVSNISPTLFYLFKAKVYSFCSSLLLKRLLLIFTVLIIKENNCSSEVMYIVNSHVFIVCISNMLVKRGDDNGGNLPEMTIKEIMVTPASKSSKRAENADWMASPMVFVFCTPDVKDSSKTNNTVLPRSPETKELPLPSHAATPQCPDFQTRWLKAEAKVVNSNYVHFHTLCHKQIFKWGKLESVTKNDVKDTPYKEERIPFAASSDEYLKHSGDPSPPKLEHYDHLLNTPPPPEITRIPDNVLKMLSQYNHNVDSSKAKEMETKAGNTTRYESGSTDYSNKENRYDYTLQIWLSNL
ncbi:SKA3 protein, partial [Prunella himalayana]|nr:SKA3 protein [Prunella himalayana]